MAPVLTKIVGVPVVVASSRTSVLVEPLPMTTLPDVLLATMDPSVIVSADHELVADVLVNRAVASVASGKIPPTQFVPFVHSVFPVSGPW